MSKFQNIDRRVLYVLLVIFISISLLFKTEIPVQPDEGPKNMYLALNALPTDKPVFIETDWTNSTRGESRGHMQALLRILMARKIKFVYFSAADPQAPEVTRVLLSELNAERVKGGLKPYEQWNDYLDLGLFPNAENSLNAIGNNLKATWGSRTKQTPDGQNKPVFESPVLAGVNKVEDCSMYVIVTASSTLDVAVERLSAKTKMVAMVTGVMGPQALPYQQAGQLEGLAIGLKGVYDLEYMMKYGVNYTANGGKPKVPYYRRFEDVAPPVSEGVTFDQGAKFYLALHVALVLMLLAILMGNLGMRKKSKSPEPTPEEGA